MSTYKEAVDEFLAQERIAVAGVSRQSGQPANLIYRRLRDRAYQVFPVNPNAKEVEGDPCFADLKSIPKGVDGVVVATTPAVAERIVEECAELGIRRVWLHRSLGAGSVSERAIDVGRERGLTVIAGGCPLMFGKTADTGHRLIMRPLARLTGALPKQL